MFNLTINDVINSSNGEVFLSNKMGLIVKVEESDFFDKTINYQNENERSVRKSILPVVRNVILKRFGDYIIPVPSNYNEYLNEIYGENWKVPDPFFEQKEEVLKNEFAIYEETRN